MTPCVVRYLCGWTHCVKSVRIRSSSGPCFSAFGLNTKRYSVSLCIQSECWKIRTTKSPNRDIFHAVSPTVQICYYAWSHQDEHKMNCSHMKSATRRCRKGVGFYHILISFVFFPTFFLLLFLLYEEREEDVKLLHL